MKLKQACSTRFSLLLFQAQRLGWSAVLGVALLLLAWGSAFWLAQQLDQREQAARASYAALRVKLAAQADGEADPFLRLASLYDRLQAPTEGGTPLEQILAIARKHEVKIDRGDYSNQREAGAPVMRTQINLPVQCSYPQLRAWLAEVMNTLPGVALDGISLKRERIESEKLQVQVRFSVFVKAG